MTIAARHSVLIVEDEALIAMELETIVERCGHVVCGVAASAEDAVAIALERRPSVILMDVRLAGERDGIDAATEIAARLRTSIVFCTAQTDDLTRIRIENCRPVAVLDKPVAEEHLRAAFAECGSPPVTPRSN